MIWVRLAIISLLPFLWLTANVGWLMDEAYYRMNEWRFCLDKMVERMEEDNNVR